MSLPPPPRKKSDVAAPSMFDKNREVEDQQARAEAREELRREMEEQDLLR